MDSSYFCRQVEKCRIQRKTAKLYNVLFGLTFTLKVMDSDERKV